MLTVLFITFFVLLLINMPIAFALGIATATTLLVEETLRRAAATGLPVEVCLSGDLTGTFADRLRRHGVTPTAQASGDLGARLTAALAGPGRRLVLGTDCPLFEPRWLLDAVSSPAEVVIGPSDDGGYWMLTLDAPCPGLFEDVPWSTPAVAETTMSRAAALGLPALLAVALRAPAHPWRGIAKRTTQRLIQ